MKNRFSKFNAIFLSSVIFLSGCSEGTETTQNTTTTTTGEFSAILTTKEESKKKTATTTATVEEDISLNTDEYYRGNLMPSDSVIQEAAEIAIKDYMAVIAVYKDGHCEAMSYEEATDLITVQLIASKLTPVGYEEQIAFAQESYDEDYATNFLSYEDYINTAIENLPDNYKHYFDDKGNALVNVEPFFAFIFGFEGKDGKVTAKTAAQRAIRWAFSLRSEENELENIINHVFESGAIYDGTNGGFIICTYNGSNTAEAEIFYNDKSFDYSKNITLTF